MITGSSAYADDDSQRDFIGGHLVKSGTNELALRVHGDWKSSAMDLLQIVLLVAAGIAGGIMAAIVGGAAVFTFPAMLAVGLPPVMATAGNTIALTPGLFIAAYYDRAQLLPFDRSFMAMVLASVAGGLIGAALLVLTPERVFAGLVPLLLGFATVLFAYAGRISTWLADPHARTPRQESRGSPRRRRCCRSPSMAAISAPAWASWCSACFRWRPAAIIAPPTPPRTW